MDYIAPEVACRWSVFDDSGSSISCLVSGNEADRKLRLEAGIHRVQRVPPTETRGRRHTSTIAVSVLPLVKYLPSVNHADIEITCSIGHGKGGQHRNKTESAVRAIHKPTGIVAYVQNNRSQHINKERALYILYSRIANLNHSTMHNEQNILRKQQIGTMGRGERVRTYNFIENRVTDERVSGKFRTEDIMKGKLELIYQAK